MVELIVGLAAGLVIGVGVALYLSKQQRRHDAQNIEQLKSTFAALSREALSSNTQDFLALAKTHLEGQTAQGEKQLDEKKKLIEARISEIGKSLGDLNKHIHDVEKERAASHGSLKTQIEKATQVTNRLHETTSQLREALANPQRRGQWGERMAEDVLRLAGFVEGVNYTKQQTISDGTRPDFTFPLPGDRVVHMDVKFPLTNYLKAMDADDDATRDASTAQFLKDVRDRIKEVTKRSYIDAAAGTLDYVMVFIPNEQVYGFMHGKDPNLLDDALRQKVVLCAPLTLYAILAVIRQSVDNFHLEQGAKEILYRLASVKKQWGLFVGNMDALGRRIESVQKEYDNLSTTRMRLLDRQFDKIDDLAAAREETVALSTSAPDATVLPANDTHAHTPSGS